MSRLRFVCLALVISLSACLSAPPATPTASSESAPSEATQATPEFQKAAAFDRFARGEMPLDERRMILEGCRAEAESNLFCFSYLRGGTLEKRVRVRARLYKPAPAKPPVPVTPQLVNGKIKSWDRVRRAKVTQLLAGLADVPVEKLQKIAQVAQKERRCPNNAAIAIAATLETYLADHPVSEAIGSLYEKGGDCASRKSYDREHFYTRAALFRILRKEYAKAAAVLSKVRSVDAYSGRALYWTYRANLALGDKATAEAALQRLRRSYAFSFHALVSANVDNQDTSAEYLKQASEPILQKRSERVTKVNTLIEQAEVLKGFGFDETADLVADWALGDFRALEPGVRLYIATLADANTKVLTLQDVLMRKPNLRNRQTMELAFPKAFFATLEKHSDLVDPYLMLAVARKESTLNPRAISPANAQGLLQMTPDTARRLKPGTEGNLLDPETNALLAARYISDLLRLMKGQLPLVIASYNAGEATVLRWIRRYPTTEPILFMDLIPYRETRDYVGFVLSNYFWYRKLYLTGANEPLKEVVNSEIARIEAVDSNRGVKSIPQTTPDVGLPRERMDDIEHLIENEQKATEPTDGSAPPTTMNVPGTAPVPPADESVAASVSDVRPADAPVQPQTGTEKQSAESDGGLQR